MFTFIYLLLQLFEKSFRYGWLKVVKKFYSHVCNTSAIHFLCHRQCFNINDSRINTISFCHWYMYSLYTDEFILCEFYELMYGKKKHIFCIPFFQTLLKLVVLRYYFSDIFLEKEGNLNGKIFSLAEFLPFKEKS